jgi:hypothetical protein
LRKNEPKSEPTKRTDDYALEALQAAEGPLHVKVLTERMIENGWDPSQKMAKPSHLVYTTLHGLIARQGAAAKFRSLGAGVFVTKDDAEQQDLDLAEVKPSKHLSNPRPKAIRTLKNETPVEVVSANEDHKYGVRIVVTNDRRWVVPVYWNHELNDWDNITDGVREDKVPKAKRRIIEWIKRTFPIPDDEQLVK